MTRYLAALILAPMLLACSVTGNITDFSKRLTVTSVGEVTGVVSAAHVQTSAGNYQITATLGESAGTVVSTSAGGMKIYNDVAGNMNSIVTYSVLQ